MIQRLIKAIISGLLIFVGFYFLAMFLVMGGLDLLRFGDEWSLARFLFYFFIFLSGLALVSGGILVLMKNINLLSIFSIILGISALITAVVTFQSGFLYSQPLISIIADTITALILVLEAVLCFLPLSFYRKTLVQKISRFWLVIFLSIVILNFIPLSVYPEEFYGDFLIIPILLLPSFVINFLCILLIKTKSQRVEGLKGN